MSLTVHTSTELFSQIANRLDTGNVQHRQYLNNLDFAKTIEAEGRQDDVSKAMGVAAMAKPSSGLFAELAGVPEADAVEILHGVVGSNVDTRDWGAIMASDDPLTAARQATAEMYGVPETGATVTTSSNAATLTQRTQAGNFAVDVSAGASTLASYGGTSAASGVGTATQAGLYLIDGNSNTLRQAGSTPEAIAHNTWLFGFDTAPLAALADAIQAAEPQLSALMQQASTAPNPHNSTAAIMPPATTPITTMPTATPVKPAPPALASAESVAANYAKTLLGLLNTLKGAIA